MIPVLTIDGPSGSGKGTVSREVAERLGWHLLDSGALYRLVGLSAEKASVSFKDGAALAEIARNLSARFGSTASGDERIWLAGEVVTDQVRTERCGELASLVAAHAAVREALVELQRGYRAPPGLVADGRDMGTVIFPDAKVKVFLTASAEERAERRHKQLKEKGIGVSLSALSREIAERDSRDANRSVAPLRAADDAIEVDSTNLSVEDVVARVLELAGKNSSPTPDLELGKP
ncbi:MAG: (d)CMP kinase [Pseudomonadota bacterium]